MSEPSLAELEAERDRLYAQLSRVGDFRRGSVSENWRKCGKPNCACAQPSSSGASASTLSALQRAGMQATLVGRTDIQAPPASGRVRDTFVGVPRLSWLWWEPGC